MSRKAGTGEGRWVLDLQLYCILLYQCICTAHTSTYKLRGRTEWGTYE